MVSGGKVLREVQKAVLCLSFILSSGACGEGGCMAPDVNIAGRGRLLAKGRFENLRMFGTEEHGAFVLALRDPDQSVGQAVVVPFEGGSYCEAGRASSYNAIPRIAYVPGKGPVLKEVVPTIMLVELLDDGDKANVRFADLDCGLRPPVLEGIAAPFQTISLPYDEISRENPLLLFKTSTGEVHIADPWNGTLTLFATGVSEMMLSYYSGYLWLVENDELAVYDLNLNPLGRFGSGVTELALAFSSPEAAFVDATGLNLLADPGESPVLIENDACKPRFLSGREPRLAYFAPCEERRLVLLDLNTKERTSYVAGVGSYSLWFDWLFYVISSEGTNVGDLWAVPPGSAPIRVGSDGHVNVDFIGLDSLLVLLDYKGGMGTLGVWGVSEGFTEIMKNVAEFDYFYDHIVVLADYDGSVGTLFLLDSSDFSVKMSASGVPRGGFFGDGYKFSRYAPALGYLEAYDPDHGVGRLRVWVITTGELEKVDEDVSEFQEVFWPEWGILYAIGRGDPAGIWFSEIEIE